jgi:1,2-diacylglycerol 3-alpha-glucosyltransferase
MPSLYLAADLFASASVSEVHPMTLIEAAACGLPAVVRRDDAYRGLVEDGYNGRLVGSDAELAQVITCLLPDAAELRRLSQNARCLAAGRTVEAQASHLEALYLELVQRPAADC